MNIRERKWRMKRKWKSKGNKIILKNKQEDNFSKINKFEEEQKKGLKEKEKVTIHQSFPNKKKNSPTTTIKINKDHQANKNRVDPHQEEMILIEAPKNLRLIIEMIS